MNGSNNNWGDAVIDDREWYMLHGRARYMRLFFDRILPGLLFVLMIGLLWFGKDMILPVVFDVSTVIKDGLELMQ